MVKVFFFLSAQNMQETIEKMRNNRIPYLEAREAAGHSGHGEFEVPGLFSSSAVQINVQLSMKTHCEE